MSKHEELAEVIEQKSLGSNIFDLTLHAPAIARDAKPGQFVSVYSGDESRLLPRPISICEADTQKGGRIRLVYRVAGAGTAEFSKCLPGDVLTIAGPLGNGFPTERMEEGKSAFLIGGGIGIPPMLELAKTLRAQGASRQQIKIVLGYQDELFLQEELAEYGEVYIATITGSTGTKGNVLDCIRENDLRADLIYACGPTPMLRALKTYALEQDAECYLSLEERMACGIGACLACVCKSAEVDGHSKVKNKRICAEGPVFLSTQIEL